MWQWLHSWRSGLGKSNPTVEGAPPPLPPTTLPHPAPRTAVAPALLPSLAVDLTESSLFYCSSQGKVVCRSIASGDIEWESKDDGYPLRVTDNILWVVQGDTIAAYVTTNGQLLMRSQPLWLPGGVAHTLCDLSQQTLRIYSTYSPPLPNYGIPHHPRDRTQEKAAYEISLSTGEITRLYQVTLRPKSQRLAENGVFEPGYDIVPRKPQASFSKMQGQSIDEQRQGFEELCRESQKAYHWPDDQELQKQAYPIVANGQVYKATQLRTASVVIYEYDTGQFCTYRTVLSVSGNQTPSASHWEAVLNEFRRELPHC